MVEKFRFGKKGEESEFISALLLEVVLHKPKQCTVIDTLFSDFAFHFFHSHWFSQKDFGTAVQVTEKFEKILVVGETTTETFKDGFTKKIKDSLTMELNPNGDVVKFELFGLKLGLDNGTLVPGNLDLHLTKDKNAVAIRNAAISGNKGNVPYLIERYPTVKGVCFHKERDVTVKDVRLGTSELQSEELEDKGEKIELEREGATLKKGR